VRILREYIRDINANQMNSPDAILKLKKQAIGEALEAAQKVDPTATWKGIAQQWHGMQRWLPKQEEPQAMPKMPLSASTPNLGPSTGFPPMEAPEFIQHKLEEARQHLAMPVRSEEARSLRSHMIPTYVPVDAVTEKSTAVLAASEPQPKPHSAETTKMSTLRVRLPNGIELFFDARSRTAVSISSPVGMTGTSVTYTIVAEIA
jgi:hypothetical protein